MTPGREPAESGDGAALVTGASAGIGLALARELASRGRDLVLVARRRERLEEVAAEVRREHGVEARVLPGDLSLEETPAEIRRELDEAGVDVEILVNNAGFGDNGPFADADLERQLDMLRVNVLALTHLTGLFLPGMVERGRGRILNVASTAAYQPGPLMAVYYASKAYVLSFSEAVDEELRGTPVTVTTLCPGPTATEFQERAEMGNAAIGRRAFMMDAATVARKGCRGMLKGRRVVIPGLANAVVARVARRAPRRFSTRVAKKLNEK